MSKPHFVKATILRDGSVRLVDDEGEIFHVELRTDMVEEGLWPLVSRQMRRYEMYEYRKKREQPVKPIGPFRPKLVS